MKSVYRIIEVANSNDVHYKLQKKYLLLFWKSVKFPNGKRYADFSSMESVVNYMNKLRVEEKTTCKIVYQDKITSTI